MRMASTGAMDERDVLNADMTWRRRCEVRRDEEER